MEDGHLSNLPLHQVRLDKSHKAHFAEAKPIQLEQAIEVPKSASKGLFKCRVEYGNEIEKIEFQPYQLPHIQSLRLVENDEIDYAYKFADRFPLYILHSKRRHADDIIIVKNGYLTDSFYANLAFLRKGAWVTPATPLLEGTQRAFLLSENVIEPDELTPKDLPKFEKVRLFNAMMRWEDEVDVEVIYS